MAKRANRGRGKKKNTKLLAREASAVLEDASLSLDCGAELSKADENCDSLNCEGVVSELEEQGVAGSVSAAKVSANGMDAISVHPEMEILEKSDVLEDKEEPTFVVPDEKRSIAQDWRQLFHSEKSLGNMSTKWATNIFNDDLHKLLSEHNTCLICLFVSLILLQKLKTVIIISSFFFKERNIKGG
jgi:hypothetical protein